MNECVCRVHVSVNDPCLVHMMNAGQNGFHYNLSLRLRAIQAASCHYIVQHVLPLNRLHYEVSASSWLLRYVVERLNDVRVTSEPLKDLVLSLRVDKDLVVLASDHLDCHKSAICFSPAKFDYTMRALCRWLIKVEIIATSPRNSLDLDVLS